MSNTEAKMEEELKVEKVKSSPVKRTRRQRKRQSDPLLSSPSMMVFGILFYGFIAWYFFLSDDELYINKESVKSDISQMIINDADLDSIKHHFNSSDKVEWGFIFGWSNNKHDYYVSSIPLLTILKDIKSDTYLAKSIDKNKQGKVSKVIKEYQQRNPFDGLEQVQKDQFNNIRIKLDENFDVVKQEVYKLSEDLNQKNLLVNQYLSDSKTSLYVSIASLIFALITTFGSQLMYRKKVQKNS
ncbi:hypothetical protein L4D08_26040 [Photobacterium chitinilyticum]|uniref:hypothetical protein n=1 Tax=Photobacterium chitinilyticum TaxID=2485123 RepID=UPI003D0C8D4A